MHTVAIYSFEDRLSAHRQKVRALIAYQFEDGVLTYGCVTIGR